MILAILELVAVQERETGIRPDVCECAPKIFDLLFEEVFGKAVAALPIEGVTGIGLTSGNLGFFEAGGIRFTRLVQSPLMYPYVPKTFLSPIAILLSTRGARHS